jgi:hypothetical protein
VRDDTAYVACDRAGLAVVDCRFPTSPSTIAILPTARRARKVEVSGSRAYVADMEGGLRIFEIASGTYREIGWYDTPYRAVGVTARGNAVLVADPIGGLYLLRDDTVSDAPGPARGSGRPPGIAVLGNTPNPFRMQTTIRFSEASGAAPDASVHIYDLAGRLVRVLGAPAGPAEVRQLDWDGRNQAGTRAAAGAYFYVIRSGDRAASGRMLLVE